MSRFVILDYRSYLSRFSRNTRPQTRFCSRVVDSKAEMTKNIGTVAWIAPEIFAKRTYGEKADVYSYGVILWELLTRKMPFGDVESFSIPLIVSRGERPVIPKDCPPDWKKLIRAGWHQKPTKRPDFKTILQRLRKMVDVRSKLGLIEIC